MTAPLRATKILSPNDVGKTGSHQAGILVPKRPDILRVFPELRPGRLNPTEYFDATDPDGRIWTLAFKYYNNRRFGAGTRDEYRITRLTSLISRAGLAAGDMLTFERGAHQWRVLWEHRRTAAAPNLDLTTGGWVVIRM